MTDAKIELYLSSIIKIIVQYFWQKKTAAKNVFKDTKLE